MNDGKKFLCVFIILGILGACQHQPGASSEEKSSFIVKFKPGVSEEVQQKVLNQLELNMEEKLDFVGAVVCRYEGELTPEQLMEESKKIPEVEYLEPNYTVETQSDKEGR